MDGITTKREVRKTLMWCQPHEIKIISYCFSPFSGKKKVHISLVINVLPHMDLG